MVVSNDIKQRLFSRSFAPFCFPHERHTTVLLEQFLTLNKNINQSLREQKKFASLRMLSYKQFERTKLIMSNNFKKIAITH